MVSLRMLRVNETASMGAHSPSSGAAERCGALLEGNAQKALYRMADFSYVGVEIIESALERGK